MPSFYVSEPHACFHLVAESLTLDAIEDDMNTEKLQDFIPQHEMVICVGSDASNNVRVKKYSITLLKLHSCMQKVTFLKRTQALKSAVDPGSNPRLVM